MFKYKFGTFDLYLSKSLIGCISYFVLLKSFLGQQPIKTQPESVSTRRNRAIGQLPCTETADQSFFSEHSLFINWLFVSDWFEIASQNDHKSTTLTFTMQKARE